MQTVLTLFGTRPEVVKLAPVVRALEGIGERIRTVNVCSSQHHELLRPFLDLFQLRVDRDLGVMRPAQSPSSVCARVLTALEPVLDEVKPDLLLVQGDTTTALAGAVAGFYGHVPVGHVEAGLRSGNVASPFPEEMNRRLITRLSTWHFAATANNVRQLEDEGVAPEEIFLTGNPVVDALQWVLENGAAAIEPAVAALLTELEGSRCIVLTTHRREAFGLRMRSNLQVIRRFVERHEDVKLVFPVHPNPSVVAAAAAVLGGHDRIRLVEPMSYAGFVALLSRAWLLVSDSGGIQEEAPTLKKPLLVLRDNTERPEAVDAGVARLVPTPELLEHALDEVAADDSWFKEIRTRENPFGRGDSGPRVARAIEQVIGTKGETDHGRKHLVAAIGPGHLGPDSRGGGNRPASRSHPERGPDEHEGDLRQEA